MVDDAPRLLSGRYQLGELIGRGGMAEVHIGHDTRLGRTVAIKVLRSDLARDPSFQARFRREAQAAAALNHPAIVAVYDTGEDTITEPTGAVSHVPFIVMEYVEGHTVRDILRDGQAVPIEEAVEITVGVLSALEYSHHAGIVHRDIKPANVMLTPTGAVKVMDFGIARAMADSAATMTQTQGVVGTAQYLSPEQARGESVDARSDLYSTGCLLFELLTGRPPFVGDSPVSVAYQHVREAAPTPSSVASDVPEVLDRITIKALAKDRDHRYSSAGEFRADLETAMRGGVVGAPAVGAGFSAPAADPAATAVLGGGFGIGSYVPEGEATTQVLGTPTSYPTQQMASAAPSPWGQTGVEASPFGGMGEDEPEEDSRKRWLLWTLIGVAVLAIAAIVLAMALNGPDANANKVDVPPVAGFTEEAAREAITAAGLGFRPVKEESDTVDAGLVIATDPPAGTPLDKGAPVTVTVSTGVGSVKVPNVTQRTQEEAIEALKEVGLTLAKTETVDVPETEKGFVHKTDPAAGESVAKGTGVTLYVASGNVELPDLTGLSRKEAIAKLDELDLRYEFKDMATVNPDEIGKVVDQDRAPGLVPQGKTIVLQLGVEAPPAEVTIPNGLVGRPVADVLNDLTRLGLTHKTTTVPSDQPEGTVLETQPGAGTVVVEGSEVNVVVSDGSLSNPDPDPTPPEGDEGDGDQGDGQSAATARPGTTQRAPRRRGTPTV